MMYQLSLPILVLSIATPLCFCAAIPEHGGNIHRTVQTEDSAELADEISKWVSRLTQDWIATTIQNMGQGADDGTLSFSKKIYPIHNHTTVEKYCVSSKDQTSCVEVGIMNKNKAEIPIQVRVRRDVANIHHGHYEDERHSDPRSFNSRVQPDSFGFNPDMRDEGMEPISKIREALPHRGNHGGQLEKLRDLNREGFPYNTQTGGDNGQYASHHNDPNARGGSEHFSHHANREDRGQEDDYTRRSRPGFGGDREGSVRSPVSYNDKNFGKVKFEGTGKPSHQDRLGRNPPFGTVRTGPSQDQFGSGQRGSENLREVNRDYNYGEEQRPEYGVPRHHRNGQENHGSHHEGQFHRDMNRNVQHKYGSEGSTNMRIPNRDHFGGSKNHPYRNNEDFRPRSELTNDSSHYMENKNRVDQLPERKNYGTEFQRLSTEDLNPFNDLDGHGSRIENENHYYNDEDDYASSKLKNPAIESIGQDTYGDENFQSARKPQETPMIEPIGQGTYGDESFQSARKSTEYTNADNGEDEYIAPNGMFNAQKKQPSAEDIFNHLIGKRSLNFDGEFRKHEKREDDYGSEEGYGNAKLLRSLERGDNGKEYFAGNKKELNSVLDSEKKSSVFGEEEFMKVPEREGLPKGNLNVNKYDENFEGGRNAELSVEQASKAYNTNKGNQRNHQSDSSSRKDNNYEHYQQNNQERNRPSSKPEHEREHYSSDSLSRNKNEREHHQLGSHAKKENNREYQQSDLNSKKENSREHHHRTDSNSRVENEREHYPLDLHSDFRKDNREQMQSDSFSRKENERGNNPLDSHSNSRKEYNQEQQPLDSFSRKENERDQLDLHYNSRKEYNKEQQSDSFSRKENEREHYSLDSRSDSRKEHNQEQQQQNSFSRKENEREQLDSHSNSRKEYNQEQQQSDSFSRKENERDHYSLDSRSESRKEHNQEQQQPDSLSRKDNEREHNPSNLNDRKVHNHDLYPSDSHPRKESSRDDYSVDSHSINENKREDNSQDSIFRKENIREPASDDPEEHKIMGNPNEFNQFKNPPSSVEKKLGNFGDDNVRRSDAIGDFGKQESSPESPVKLDENDGPSDTPLGQGSKKYDFSKSNEKSNSQNGGSVKKNFDFGYDDDVLEDNFTEERKSQPNFNTNGEFENRFSGEENPPGKGLPESASDWADMKPSLNDNKDLEENPIKTGGFGSPIGEEVNPVGIFEEFTEPLENQKEMMGINDDPMVRRKRSSTNNTDVDERKDFHLCRLPKPSKTYEALCKMLPKEAKCNLYCIRGHTFPEGIMKQTTCSQYTGKWTTRFDECKPFVDCSLRLKTAGSLDCEISSLLSGKKCSISCTREGVFDESPLKEYECQPNGKWSPSLPHCVESDGVSLVRPPAVKEIKDFIYP